MTNKKEFSYLMRFVCKGYSCGVDIGNPTLEVGHVFSLGQINALKEVLDLTKKENVDWLRECEFRCKEVTNYSYFKPLGVGRSEVKDELIQDLKTT